MDIFCLKIIQAITQLFFLDYLAYMQLIEPASKEEFTQYFELRWKILRQPWNQPRGSEQDAEEDQSYHIMAVENGLAIGVARLQFPSTEHAQLRYMAVDTPQQNKGVGTNIVTHIEDYARQHKSKFLFLHARENALGFYKQLGYTVTEKSYLLFDNIQHYKMQKTL